MPPEIAEKFAKEFDLNSDTIKMNLYRKDNPNTYLAHFAEFIFKNERNGYFYKLLHEGLTDFVQSRVMSYPQVNSVPVHFIGTEGSSKRMRNKAQLPGTPVPPQCALLDRRTIEESLRKTAGCRQIAYSSVVVRGKHPEIVPPPGVKPGCSVFFVGRHTLQSQARLVYIIHRTVESTKMLSARRMSKVIKLSPDCLFAQGSMAVFYDTKLHMAASIQELASLSSRPFAAMAHPSIGAWPSDSAVRAHMSWEATAVVTANELRPRADNASLLLAQVRRYNAEKDTFWGYIDGALLLIKAGSAPFMRAWREEVMQKDSSDRDQPAFAHVARRFNRKTIQLLDPHGLSGRRYKHWYFAGDVAYLRRTVF